MVDVLIEILRPAFVVGLPFLTLYVVLFKWQPQKWEYKDWYACPKCGYENDTMLGACESCGNKTSRRLVRRELNAEQEGKGETGKDIG